MALFDGFADQIDPDVISRLREIQSDLVRRPIDERLELYDRLDIDGYVAEIASLPWTPPAGVFGVGMWDVFEAPVPAFFVVGHPHLTEFRVADEVDYSRTASALIRMRLGYVPVGFGAVELPPTQPQCPAEPGTSIACMNNRGTLGVGVWTRSGMRGITTAGHVASEVGAAVAASGRDIGVVESTDQPANHGVGTDCADLAVVALEDHVESLSLPGQTARGAQLEEIRSIVTPDDAGFIRGVSESWAYETASGSWGDVLITDHAISEPGHSGAPCLDRDDNVVGHVVAGAVPAYSLVQDVNYQLTRAGVRPRFG